MENLMISLRREAEKELESDRKANMQLFKKRERAYNKIKGIRTGDWVKENGKYTRVPTYGETNLIIHFKYRQVAINLGSST